MNGSLDKRLLSCADYVRAGAVFADIGTDHGYLPIFLLKAARIDRAYLSDVNPGPLSSAERNAAAEGLSDRCEFILTDGAAALSGKGITDYAICGMGGELIARIIEDAPHLKDGSVRLILQPMTKQEHLRHYLALAGFRIICERFSFDSGKYYVTMVAEYSGECRELSDEEAELGPDFPHEGDRVEYLGFLEGKRKAARKALTGKSAGGYETVREEERIGIIEKRIAKLTGA
ncbi:MAG: SAM-dependent methyltransferase [Clostridia bacterium]|nr:SAM-dependent methyltransferase [Clostridia bacterium]